MASYLAPGVYVEEVSFRAPSIEGVGTSTAAFAGPTLTGPVNLTPELLTSFGDFQNTYGGFDNLALAGIAAGDLKNVNYLALGVKAFFDNGGSQLYVSRVFAPKATGNSTATAVTFDKANVGITARFPGFYANGPVVVTLKATKTQAVSGLPAGSLLATVPPGAASITILADAIKVNDTQVVVVAAPNSAVPFSILVDDEILNVTAVDHATATLTLAQGAASAHTAATPVYPAVALLTSELKATDTTLPWPQTASSCLPVGSVPPHLQIEQETIEVTGVDSTGKLLNLVRGAKGTTAADHTASLPIFAPAAVTFYTSGGGNSTLNALPVPTPANLYTLTMSVTAQSASGSPQVYDGLGFDPAHPNYLGAALASTPPRAIDALENQIAFTIAAGVAPDKLYAAIFGSIGSPFTNSVQSYALQGGDDGVEPGATDYANALAYFTALEDVAIVAAPGSGAFDASQDVINALITHVSQQRAYRVAVLETPPLQIASDNENVRSQIDSSYAALYVPWVVTANPLASSGSSIAAEISVPPSGFIAGIYARSDQQNGVSKAPANEVVLGASRFERNITFAEQGLLNPLGINCLRYFPDRGYRVWGARTATSDSEFMYVNVRRYLIYLEHSIDNSTQWAVFENNGPSLWARVEESINAFLYNEWKQGSLLGDTPAQAYFVRCDRTTMTQNDLDNGRMICLIGVALLKPAEFVIFRIGQMISPVQS